MDKEALELQKQWTESRVKRIREEIEKFEIQRKKYDVLIEDDEKEIEQLQKSLKKSIEEYLSDKPYEAIEHFIKEYGYTYTVNDVIEGYKKHKQGLYNSYTMNICIQKLQKYLNLIDNNKNIE
jgi:hypothetical protein